MENNSLFDKGTGWRPVTLSKMRSFLKVFSKDFAQIFSCLSRLLNFFETSIFQNTFWLAGSNHSNQFLWYSNLQKLYVQWQTLNMSSGNPTELTEDKKLCSFKYTIYWNIYQHWAKRFILDSVNHKQTV